mmetsp:Transcript_12215/g.32784  ORF Transcript_12215/g.32784 Transcript_12215/m.32784 type:complete len:443 (+) Transcript_12215:594-1922(+)
MSLPIVNVQLSHSADKHPKLLRVKILEQLFRHDLVKAHNQGPELRAHIAYEEVLAQQLGVLLAVRLRHQHALAPVLQRTGAVPGDECQRVHAPIAELGLADLGAAVPQQRVHAVPPEVRVQLPHVPGPQTHAQQALEDQERERDGARTAVHECQRQQPAQRPGVALMLLVARRRPPGAVGTEAQDREGLDEGEGRGLRTGHGRSEAIHEVLPDASHVQALLADKLDAEAEVIRERLQPRVVAARDAEEQVRNAPLRELRQRRAHEVRAPEDDGDGGLLEELRDGLLIDMTIALRGQQLRQILGPLRDEPRQDDVEVLLRCVARRHERARGRAQELPGARGHAGEAAGAARLAHRLPQGRELHLPNVGHDSLAGAGQLGLAPQGLLQLQCHAIQHRPLSADGVLPEEPQQHTVARHDQQTPRQKVRNPPEHHRDIVGQRTCEA